MKRTLTVIAFVPLVAVLLLLSRSEVTRTQARSQAAPQQSVFFGFLLGITDIAAVAIDLTAPDDQGQRVLRAYVCDGFGPPEGMAVWFRGTVDAAEMASGVGGLSFTSVAGQETLVIHALMERGVYGAFTNARGVTAHFVAYPGFDGAGIYQVTLDEALHYSGTSTQGAVLDAQATPDGRTSGTITLPDGKTIDFAVRSLALASPADLSAHGLSEEYRNFAAFNQVPGEYVAVIAPGGSHWFGRDGFVSLGLPGLNIIGLDKKVGRRIFPIGPVGR